MDATYATYAVIKWELPRMGLVDVNTIIGRFYHALCEVTLASTKYAIYGRPVRISDVIKRSYRPRVINLALRRFERETLNWEELYNDALIVWCNACSRWIMDDHLEISRGSAMHWTVDLTTVCCGNKMAKAIKRISIP